MSEVVVRPVSTRRERKAFLEFPWTLYRNDPHWIPPIRADQKEMVGFSRHPFDERNRAQTFLAYRNGEVCGRVAARLNVGHIERYHDSRGFFGFVECRRANALSDACREWFAAQGISAVRGPTNPSPNYALGLLIDGFDSPPTFMMTYNPPYYERLLETYGFREAQDLYAFWGHISMLPERDERLRPVCGKIINRFNARVRPLDKPRFHDDVRTFPSIYNRSLTSTWGCLPMSEAQAEHLAKGLRQLLVPELKIAAAVDGQVVGATLGLPDYNPRIRLINGRRFPFGFVRLLYRKRAIKKIRVISTSVLPEYQLQGLGLVLLDGLVPKTIEWGIEEAEFSWVLESNALSRGALAKGGERMTKTYRLYDLTGTRGERVAH